MKTFIVILLQVCLWLVVFVLLVYAQTKSSRSLEPRTRTALVCLFALCIFAIYALGIYSYAAEDSSDSFDIYTSLFTLAIPNVAAYMNLSLPQSAPTAQSNSTSVLLVPPGIGSHQWHPPFARESDIAKLPNASFDSYLYRGESAFFANMTHYHDNWRHIAGTDWSIPSNIKSSMRRIAKYKRWNYKIIDYPIYPFFLSSTKQRQSDMITIVTQCSLNRLAMIRMVASKWFEIISLAVYVPLETSLVSLQSTLHSFWLDIERNTTAILDIHLLFEYNQVNRSKRNGGFFSILYPVNHLRNVALQCARSEYVLLTDADFVPSKRFHVLARKNYAFAMQHIANTTADVALILPAFELKLTREAEFQLHVNSTKTLPLSKSKLVKAYKHKLVRAFHSNRCPRCHNATNVRHWLKADTLEPYEVEYKSHYEPYIMVRRLGLHRYDARFRGYGLNKIYHLRSLNILYGYRWIVSSHCFLFHIPHEQSRDNRIFRKKGQREWLYGLAHLAKYELHKKRDASGKITG